MELQKSLFEGREGEIFYLHDMNNPPISLTLTEIGSPDERILLRAYELGIREPFNLLFFGPQEPFLEQNMYVLQHAELAKVDVFLVPVKQDENGYYYEAIFG